MDKRTDLTPQKPEVPTLGHEPGDRMKSLSDMFYLFYLWDDIQIIWKNGSFRNRENLQY